MDQQSDLKKTNLFRLKDPWMIPKSHAPHKIMPKRYQRVCQVMTRPTRTLQNAVSLCNKDAQRETAIFNPILKAVSCCTGLKNPALIFKTLISVTFKLSEV